MGLSRSVKKNLVLVIPRLVQNVMHFLGNTSQDLANFVATHLCLKKCYEERNKFMSTPVEMLQSWFDSLSRDQQEEVVKFLYDKFLIQLGSYFGPLVGSVYKGLHIADQYLMQ